MTRRPVLTLVAACLVTGTLGSIHAYSVLLTALENRFEASRADISLIYSLALVFLTLAVLLGYRLFRLVSPPVLVLCACWSAALGLFLCVVSTDWWLLCLGYSVIFGAANGLGYGYVLQLVALAMPRHRGFAMGTVTALYAVGATAFSKLLAELLLALSLELALAWVAVIIALAGGAAGAILRASGARYDVPVDTPKGGALSLSLTLQLWLAYGAGVAAGLMAIGHATGIAEAAGAEESQAVLGAIFVAIGNAAGGFAIGLAADRVAAKQLLVALPLLSASSLTALALVNQPIAAVVCLGIIGFCYGAIIAVYPYTVALAFGQGLSAQAYGRVFTAWGTAGLCAPWLAGYLYDSDGNYFAALLVAAGIGLISALTALWLPRLDDSAPRTS